MLYFNFIFYFVLFKKFICSFILLFILFFKIFWGGEYFLVLVIFFVWSVRFVWVFSWFLLLFLFIFDFIFNLFFSFGHDLQPQILPRLNQWSLCTLTFSCYPVLCCSEQKLYKAAYEKLKDRYSVIVDDPRNLLAKWGSTLSSQVLWGHCSTPGCPLHPQQCHSPVISWCSFAWSLHLHPATQKGATFCVSCSVHVSVHPWLCINGHQESPPTWSHWRGFKKRCRMNNLCFITSLFNSSCSFLDKAIGMYLP